MLLIAISTIYHTYKAYYCYHIAYRYMACGVTDGMTDTIVTSDLSRFTSAALDNAVEMIRCYKAGRMDVCDTFNASKL